MKNAPRLVLLLLLLAGAGAQTCRAELTALQVTSAYVFNFIKFVKWPSAAVKPKHEINLCVLGNDELHASLSALDERKAGEYRLRILPRATGNAGLAGCHVLFIGAREGRRHIQIIKSLGDAPILTISDIPGFAERGGSIGLLRHNDRMLFEVNLTSTRKAGLQLSGQMLNLSSNVIGK